MTLMDFESIAADIQVGWIGSKFIHGERFRRQIVQHLRAAFAAGREAMREEAAVIADTQAIDRRKHATQARNDGRYANADTLRHGAVCAEEIAAAIRALPGKEGE